MTLVIAGHDIKKDASEPGFIGSMHGLFVAADSTITDGNQTLLTGFKKIYKVPIKVFKPYFTGEQFRGYQEVRLDTNCFIAFAGSTLTAQHILNGVMNHLGELRYACEGATAGVPGTYQILMKCQPNSLLNSMLQCSDDMFLHRDMEDLLTGEMVANTVLHVLKTSLASAKKHKIDEAGCKSLLTEYVLGTYCQVDKRHKLYTFKPRFKMDHGCIVCVEIDQEEIPPGSLAVLGMPQFSPQVHATYKIAFETKQDVKKAIFDVLNMVIDDAQASGDRRIDHPAILYGFHNGEMTEIFRSKTSPDDEEHP